MSLLGLIVILVIAWVYYWCFRHPSFDEVSLDEVLSKNKFKTGDLILFKAVDNFNGSFIMSYYGHIGVVYADSTGVYVFEAANTTNMTLNPDQNANGIFMSPLADRIKMYKGYAFYKELKDPLDAATCDEFRSFIDYCIENMSYETRVMANGIKKGMGEKIGMQVNCGELVFLSLIKLGLLPLEYYYKPAFHHLRWMCDIKILPENEYLEPVKLTYSPIAHGFLH